MQSCPAFFSRCRLWLLAPAILLTAGPLRAADDPVAVFSEVFNGYQRTQLPDKSFKPEYYAFGEGGCWTRPVQDAKLEEMTFLRVAQAVAAPLARLNYRPARNAAEAELMILVFWGSTQGSRGHDPTGSADRFASASSAYNATKSANQAPPAGSPAEPANAAAESAYDNALWQMQLANDARDQLDSRNARILGYSEALERARAVAHMSFAHDIIDEISDNRYYVVLQAYDAKTAVKEKKLKPLWTARISMRESDADFAQALEQMLRRATRYLGQDSKGLHREVTQETSVRLGPTEYLETLPPTK
jgi:hypothetical protein